MSQNISNFVTGLNTFFIGVVVVFGMLCLLILMISILGMVMARITNKAQAAQKTVTEEVQAAKEEVVATVVKEEKAQDDLELVAVITAVIAASMGTTSDKLQVRSLRKVQRKSL